MTRFQVHGPHPVSFQKGAAAKYLDSENVKKFWDDHPSHARERGCYVFAMKNKGLVPWYVGRATKSFKQEVFSIDKLNKYNNALAKTKKGRPVLFFVAAPKKQGAPNVRHISKLERYLIRVAADANPDLLNVHGTKRDSWSVVGVLRSGQGKPGKPAIALRRSLKLGSGGAA